MATQAEWDALPVHLTVEEAARLLRVSTATVYSAVRRNELPKRRVGRLIYIPAGELKRHMGVE